MVSPSTALLAGKFTGLNRSFAARLPMSGSVPVLCVHRVTPSKLTSVHTCDARGKIIGYSFDAPIAARAAEDVDAQTFAAVAAPSDRSGDVFPRMSPAGRVFSRGGFGTGNDCGIATGAAGVGV